MDKGDNNCYYIYTDGGCHVNPGPGGFGVAVFNSEYELVDWYAESDPYTTNNIMELRALGWAVQYCSNLERPASAIIFTDSAYALGCITKWAPAWIRNGWITSKNEPVQNKELIESIYNNYNTNFLNMQVEIQKVKGHSGLMGNEIVDRLANQDFSSAWKIIAENKVVVSCNVDKLKGTSMSSQT